MLAVQSDKNNILKALHALNVQLLKDFISVKQQFENSSISNNEISNKLKLWKSLFNQTVDKGLEQIVPHGCGNSCSEEGVSYSLVVKQITKKYGSDQQYIETIRCLNSTTDMIKQYIRIKAIKDPTTAVFEKEGALNKTSSFIEKKGI